MEWESIRSWRDPGFWLPLAGALLLVCAIALLGNRWTLQYLESLDLLRASDPAAAAEAAKRGLRVLGGSVCAFTLVSGAVLARYFQLAFREQRLPPSGWWSLGARRAAVGPGTRTLSRLGLGLSGLLVTAGFGCLFAVHRLLGLL